MLTKDRFFQEEYNKHHVLSQREDVILEARRVLLNEDIDKIASIALSDTAIEINVNTKQCRQNVQWNDAAFWQDIPNPKNNNQMKVKNDHQFFLDQNTLTILSKINDVERKSKEILRPAKQDKRNKKLLRSYFEKWHSNVLKKVESRKIKEENEAKKEKLDNFMKNLKKFKKTQLIDVRKHEETLSDTAYSKREVTDDTVDRKKEMKKENRRLSLDPSTFENRFKAQKSIIEAQKAKLDAQNKQIEELKMGIIKEELIKSFDNAKIDIREVFKNCSERVKCKVIPQLEFVEKERERFMVNTQKAPRIVQQMEQRSLERALKREIILERKRLLEEKKKRLAEETIEKKRTQDEEERKRNLEIIKERRQKEMELEKIRQINKQKFMEKLNLATNFYYDLIRRKAFNSWKDYYLNSKMNEVISENHYSTKLLGNSFRILRELVDDKYRIKYRIADEIYNMNILRWSFKNWKEMYIESTRSMQVAEDVYDFRLQSNTFIHWHRNVCVEIMATEKKIVKARNHYNRRILFQYFYQWRSLPAVLQLEKAKEEKKRKWREKVWEILPDYKPPTDDDF